MSTWEENVRKVTPYTPGEQPNRPQMIKLNTNENPYPPAPGVAEVLRHPDEDALRRYPDPAASVLVNALAENYHVKPEQVFVGVGSDDVLAMAFMTFFNSEKPILFPDISYSFYPVWAEEFRIPHTRVALDENFCIRKEDYYGENGGIVFPNPNAPTALAMGLDAVEDIIRHNPDVVVIVSIWERVYWSGVEVGRCAQTIYGYTVDKNIGFATVRADVPDGAELTVGCNDSPAVVVNKVFC